MRVLVADDDTDTCLSVCSMLREIGMRPDWTNYGTEAVEKMESTPAGYYDIILMDIQMPQMNTRR